MHTYYTKPHGDLISAIYRCDNKTGLVTRFFGGEWWPLFRDPNLNKGLGGAPGRDDLVAAVGTGILNARDASPWDHTHLDCGDPFYGEARVFYLAPPSDLPRLYEPYTSVEDDRFAFPGNLKPLCAAESRIGHATRFKFGRTEWWHAEVADLSSMLPAHLGAYHGTLSGTTSMVFTGSSGEGAALKWVRETIRGYGPTGMENRISWWYWQSPQITLFREHDAFRWVPELRAGAKREYATWEQQERVKERMKRERLENEEAEKRARLARILSGDTKDMDVSEFAKVVQARLRARVKGEST